LFTTLNKALENHKEANQLLPEMQFD